MITNQIINQHGVEITTFNYSGNIHYSLKYWEDGEPIVDITVGEILVDVESIKPFDLMEEEED